ncbi:MAG TPA: hypothetical protein DEP84_35035, partial [Chloroflexi bacterium]|nr:hypothetical protein [Chloroflexota bacterium]
MTARETRTTPGNRAGLLSVPAHGGLFHALGSNVRATALNRARADHDGSSSATSTAHTVSVASDVGLAQTISSQQTSEVNGQRYSVTRGDDPARGPGPAQGA